jgi:uncharacterized YccA/Bax inhibitor family protein
MSSNPILNDKHLSTGNLAASQATDAAFEDMIARGGPLDDNDTFRISGVISKTLLLLSILVAAGLVGWNLVDEPQPGFAVEVPGIIFLGFIVGLAAMFGAMFRPKLAPVLGPVYAVAYGIVVGGISHVYNLEYEGIVLQAVIATAAVFFTMLLLFTSRTIRVTPRMRQMVMIATAGVMAMYLFQFAIRLFTNFEIPFLHDAGPIGILVSVALIGLAAFNLVIDFDAIERAEQARAAKSVEWVAALGLVVTLVWLYMEVLRLISKLRR